MSISPDEGVPLKVNRSGIRLPAANRAGFTLVEMLVALAIILILIAVLAVAAQGPIMKAVRTMNTTSTLQSLESIHEDFRDLTNGPARLKNAPDNDWSDSMDLFLQDAVKLEGPKAILDNLGDEVFKNGKVLDGWGNEIVMWGDPQGKARWFWSFGADGVNQSMPSESPHNDNDSFGNPVKGDDIGGNANQVQD